jgi:tellurite resistance protein
MRNYLIGGCLVFLFGLWLFFGVEDAGQVGLLIIVSSLVMLGIGIWNPQSKDRTSDAPAPDPSPQQHIAPFPFSQEEWITLLSTPLRIYQAVAGADGHIDRHENEGLIAELQAAKTYDAPLFQQVLLSWAADWKSVAALGSGDSRNIPEALRDVRRILDATLDSEAARKFKENVYRLACAIAESGGEGAPDGGVLQMPKASLDEQDVLIDISIILGLREGIRPLSPWVEYFELG